MLEIEKRSLRILRCGQCFHTIPFLLMFFALSYWIFYNFAHGRFASDHVAHIDFISPYIKGDLAIPHPLYHILTYYTSKILGLNLATAVIIVLYTFQVLIACTFIYVLTTIYNTRQTSIVLLGVFCTVIKNSISNNAPILITAGVLILHVISGIVYTVKIAKGGSFYGI